MTLVHHRYTHYTSLHIITHHCTSLHIITHHYTSLHQIKSYYLVGGFKHFLFSIVYGLSSFHWLISYFSGWFLNHQPVNHTILPVSLSLRESISIVHAVHVPGWRKLRSFRSYWSEPDPPGMLRRAQCGIWGRYEEQTSNRDLYQRTILQPWLIYIYIIIIWIIT